MALAAATHHSAQRGEWRDLHEAPRGQRTASAEATYDALRCEWPWQQPFITVVMLGP